MHKFNYRLVISYEGTDFSGWARQPGRRTVEGVLRGSLNKILKQREDVKLRVAGRTDKGVHALNQVVNFHSELDIGNQQLRRAINSLLPPDVYVKSAMRVPAEFDSRKSALKRHYIYRLKHRKLYDPFERNGITYFDCGLDTESMRKASRLLIGTHDFSAFCSVHASPGSKTRELHDIHITGTSSLKLTFTANSFLMHMIRLITGSLLEVGRRKWKPEFLKHILETRDNRLSGAKTAPQGLYLYKIDY